jgi:hypothetical protein
MGNKITKYSFSISLATAKLKKAKVKKHQGTPLVNGISSQCNRGRHPECYATTCKCKECPCKFNV